MAEGDSWACILSVAKNLNVDVSTVTRTLKLFWMTGTVAKRPYPSNRAYRELTASAQLFIITIVVERPGIYLEEIKKELEDFMAIDISVSTICKFLGLLARSFVLLQHSKIHF